MIIIPYFIGLVASVIVFTKPVTCRYLQFFQQEEYDDERFIRWLFKNLSFEKRAVSLCLLALAVFGLLWAVSLEITVLSILFTIIFYIFTLWAGMSNKTVTEKKALAYTSRANRILYITTSCQVASVLILYGACVALVYHYVEPGAIIPLSFGLFLTILIYLLYIPFSMLIANRMLAPYEYSVQRGFLNEAKEKLKEYEPRIIGITGSYGKTSIKHILSHILSSHEPTLATPGSVNTQMGITRIIREKLRPEHRNFIVEMGAYGIGSIQRLCDLTPPNIALVSAVGLAHYERFQSIDTVKQAKSELPQNVPKEGFAILNGDDENVRGMAEMINCPAFFYGEHGQLGELHCRLLESDCVDSGTRCVFEYENTSHEITLALYGKHQALNAAGAFLLAAKLGVPLLTIKAALKSTPAIAHRLVVQKSPEGVTHIDDTYNSNPEGFRNALEVLRSLNGQRKILLTPGMVELGKQHDAEHEKIGKQAAEVCDYVALIAPHRIEAMRQGLINNGFPEENLKTFDSLHQAREWLSDFLQLGDVLLLENDLPDLYESRSAFQWFQATG